VTCHKSQGSQWSNVLIVNETFKGVDPNEHGYNPEWLYTAITRAENASILVMKKPAKNYQGFRAA
jgi:exodeoxyribonuclease-5